MDTVTVPRSHLLPEAADLRPGDEVRAVGDRTFRTPATVALLVTHAGAHVTVVLDSPSEPHPRVVLEVSADTTVDLAPPF